ncbi:ABC transporter [Paucibacter sp. KBW04]|uniref:ABC1 kinase family protein n=1 Tax=Paucibacter sp. KBW04 TaxID=2153361 RepID=UPI000F56230A|nr:AarF/ABC1/UbiB kinase family protein [Paucibacter sp. KBW04]RQO55381.1 ABC transporter [Paucibacter sp. KBW04]
MSSTPRQGRLARSGVAGLALAKVGLAKISHGAAQLARDEASRLQAQAAHEEKLGRILFSALNQLKGTALKASQLLSMELGLLPEGLREQLAQAHYQATPLNRAHVIKLLRQEFGQGPEQLFAEFQPQAFAAASLGQVHEARAHSGERLAVKLQYPGMAATIASDMSLLRGLLRGLQGGGLAGLPDEKLLKSVLADIELKLAEELDYQREAAELSWFAQQALPPELVVPKLFPGLSSGRVLSMEMLEGLHLEAWLAQHPSQALRDHFGQLLLTQFVHSLLGLRRLQADPHPGNYLFMAQGRLGLLDFGRTLDLPGAFVDLIQSAWRARLAIDDAALLQTYRESGLIAPSLSLREFQAQLLPILAPLLDWQLEPWRHAHYDFGQLKPLPRMDAAAQAQAMALLHQLPPELPFFDRAYLGLLQMLRRLGARVTMPRDWLSRDRHQEL